MSDKPRIGFVGLGIMGAPIVQNLAEKGYQLAVWNLEKDRFEKVRDTGAQWADSPKEVWAASDIVFVCVLGDDALESVCFGENGFAEAEEGAKLLVDLSTSSPKATLALSKRLKDEVGADWIDAPMSGGPQPAREGKLTLMVGSEEKLFEGTEPLLRDIAANVTRTGDLGAGQTMKILNQAIVGVNYILMAELLATAKAAGIDPDLLPNTLKGGLADSAILQRIYTQMAADDFDPPRSYARQVNKDLKSVKEFIHDLGLELPVIELAANRYADYVAQGNEMEDSASVSRLYEKKDG